ncbi:TetR/AcrR family transcriptional regulator [Nocardia carnea]|uniref:TetR/AcrR family transcriptional regulator n=1 Tax=Nocardia carnea TaxID=37328 RepID=UPI002456096A|nr:helix-turn-helix domain-containing protein [Nocardia carnea]
MTAASRVVDEHVDRDTSRGKFGHDLFVGPGFGQILDHHLHRVAVAAARPLRADAERTVRTILDAAERVLGQNPNATLEQIAEAAGVARTTVHRRFAGRDELIRTMAIEAWRRMDAAVDAARPHTAPPLAALHQATANIIAIKHGAAYARTDTGADNPGAVSLRFESFRSRGRSYAYESPTETKQRDIPRAPLTGRFGRSSRRWGRGPWLGR